MSMNNEKIEALKVQIKSSVNEAFERFLSDDQVAEGKGKKMDEKYDDKEKEKMEEEEESEDDDKEKGDEDEEDDSKSVTEAMSVTAAAKGSRGKDGISTLQISRLGDLVKLANSGKYEYFTVEKKNGDIVEYHVDYSGGRPKLVEM